MSYKVEEYMKHIVAQCTTIALCEYTHRNNNVAGYIHWTICKHMGLQVTDKDYENIPEKVINVNSATIMWDIAVITDRKIPAN